MASTDSAAPRWLPLESNPEVMNGFVHGLGVPKDIQFVDVLGLDPELLAMVPEPVLAVLLLFPTNDKYDEFRKEQEASLKAAGEQISDDVYYMKQTIENACGTIALIHSIINNREKINLAEGSHIAKFFERTKGLTPEERGAELEKDKDICSCHSEHALLGQSAAPAPQEDVSSHFVSLVNVGGELYELDGRKAFPIKHGPTSGDSLLQDAVAVSRKFMERDPGELRFGLVALTSGN